MANVHVCYSWDPLKKKLKVSPTNLLGWGKSCFTRQNGKLKVCSVGIFDHLCQILGPKLSSHIS